MTNDLRDQIVEAAIAYHKATRRYEMLDSSSNYGWEAAFDTANAAEEALFMLVQSFCGRMEGEACKKTSYKALLTLLAEGIGYSAHSVTCQREYRVPCDCGRDMWLAKVGAILGEGEGR